MSRYTREIYEFLKGDETGGVANIILGDKEYQIIKKPHTFLKRNQVMHTNIYELFLDGNIVIGNLAETPNSKRSKIYRRLNKAYKKLLDTAE